MKIQQKSVISINQVLYTHAYKSWMALVEIEFSLPHNPSVDWFGEGVV
jgi:hypothetical protein